MEPKSITLYKECQRVGFGSPTYTREVFSTNRFGAKCVVLVQPGREIFALGYSNTSDADAIELASAELLALIPREVDILKQNQRNKSLEDSERFRRNRPPGCSCSAPGYTGPRFCVICPVHKI